MVFVEMVSQKSQKFALLKKYAVELCSVFTGLSPRWENYLIYVYCYGYVLRYKI